MKILSGSLLLLAMVLALVGESPPARACSTARGKDERVRIASESALIVWDEKTKTQHFIRRASFQTRVPYFGFLVPTPTLPELAETPDSVFESLEEWSKAEETTKWRPSEPIGGCSNPSMKDNDSAIEVLGRQRVAGFDAVKLKARDGQALRAWLEEHGYDARPQLMAWVEPYVNKGWIITAFQIVKTDKQEESLSTRAVRMSFATDRPFFPYREPSDAEKDSGHGRRLLRLFVVASQRMQGELDGASPWQGKAVWANPLTAEQHETLGERIGLREAPLPEKAWLTVFDDQSAPRPSGGDLFFSPSADQATLTRPPIIHYKTYYMPGSCEVSCVLVLGVPVVLLVLGIWRWTRRPPTAG